MANDCKILYLYPGNDKTVPVTFKNNGVAVDITGYSFRFTVKPEFSSVSDDSDAIINKLVTSHVDPVNGSSSIEINQADITYDMIGSYVSDIRLIDDSSNETNTSSFPVIISLTVTNSGV